jgi:hypothetical protein
MTLLDRYIRVLIDRIDMYHGNELKDRSDKSIQDEIGEVKEWLTEHMIGLVIDECNGWCGGMVVVPAGDGRCRSCGGTSPKIVEEH